MLLGIMASIMALYKFRIIIIIIIKLIFLKIIFLIVFYTSNFNQSIIDYFWQNLILALVNQDYKVQWSVNNRKTAQTKFRRNRSQRYATMCVCKIITQYTSHAFYDLPHPMCIKTIPHMYHC